MKKAKEYWHFNDKKPEEKFNIVNNTKTSKKFLFRYTNLYNKNLYKEHEVKDYICTICNSSVNLSECISYHGLGVVCDDCRCKIQALLGMTDEEFIMKHREEATKE